MTVTVTSTFVRAAGNNVTTVVNFPFLVTSSGDLVVRDILDSTGTPTTLTLNTHYTVHLSATGEGGTVTFLSALVSGHTYDIRSNIPATQGEDIRNQGRFLPEVHEGVFDKAVRLIQDLTRKVGQSIQAPDYEASAPNFTLPNALQRALNYLAFDVNGNTVVTSGTGGGDASLRNDLANTTTAGKGNDMVSYRRTPAEIAASVTPVSSSYLPLNVFRYMTAAQISDVIGRNLTLDVRAAVQAAISVAQQSPGGEVYLPSGAYLIRRVAGGDAQFNGIVVPYTNFFGYAGAGISIRGDGQSTTLYAGDNSMTIIRWSDGNGRLDNLSIDGNSKTVVSGLSVIGSNTANAALAENIDDNTFSRLSINACAEGIEIESPSAGGAYYNRFSDIRLYNNTRHIRCRDNAAIGGVNGNVFYGVVMVGGNCGVWNDGADTLMFINCASESISTGTSPCATPTAFKTMVGTLKGFLPSDNAIIGWRSEACTRNLDLGERRIAIIGGNIAFGTNVGSTPDSIIGSDATQRLRELLFGDAAADGLFLTFRQSAYQAYCQLVSSANAAGAFPFDQDGSVLLQSRETANNGIQLAVGASSTKGLDLRGTGDVMLRAGSSLVYRKVTVPYSASMTLDTTQGNFFEIIVTNGTAFTINAPTNPVSGRPITIQIFNTSGGVLGAVTWNATFKWSAWTQPANGNNRSITFMYNPNAWYQVSQTGVDVPN